MSRCETTVGKTESLERTEIPGVGDVILTAGMTQASGGRIFGCFASEEDARSVDADSLAVAIIGADRLTAEQIELADRNSDRLCQ